MDLLGTVVTHLATIFVYFSCNSVEVVYITSNESDPVAVLGEKSTKNEKKIVEQIVTVTLTSLRIYLRCCTTSTCKQRKEAGMSSYSNQILV